MNECVCGCGVDRHGDDTHTNVFVLTNGNHHIPAQVPH
jgi:hypothetical protein